MMASLVVISILSWALVLLYWLHIRPRRMKAEPMPAEPVKPPPRIVVRDASILVDGVRLKFDSGPIVVEAQRLRALPPRPAHGEEERATAPPAEPRASDRSPSG